MKALSGLRIYFHNFDKRVEAFISCFEVVCVCVWDYIQQFVIELNEVSRRLFCFQTVWPIQSQDNDGCTQTVNLYICWYYVFAFVLIYCNLSVNLIFTWQGYPEIHLPSEKWRCFLVQVFQHTARTWIWDCAGCSISNPKLSQAGLALKACSTRVFWLCFYSNWTLYWKNNLRYVIQIVCSSSRIKSNFSTK